MIVYYFKNIDNFYFLIHFFKNKSLWMDQIHSILPPSIVR